MNSHGVEGAIVSTLDAAIVVFRGTSSVGTDVPLADYLADADDDARPVTIAGKKMNVHDGFWTAAASIYPFIFQHAGAADLAGRKVWVTGHSLGAAIATLTALRLHYDDGVNVQGLQTFGSPKAGDVNLLKMFQSPNADGRVLGDATFRWVVDGDPVTTFFLKDLVGYNLSGPIYVYYQHVGSTNTIYALENGGYETKYSTGENKYMLWDVGGLNAEHMWYLEALICELTVSLMDAGQLDVLEEILQAP
jgi:hypothetical protein